MPALISVGRNDIQLVEGFAHALAAKRGASLVSCFISKLGNANP